METSKHVAEDKRGEATQTASFSKFPDFNLMHLPGYEEPELLFFALEVVH